MHMSGIIHLLQQALGDFPVYVHSLWQLYSALSCVAIHFYTEGEQKCRLHQSGPQGGVNHASLWKVHLEYKALRDLPSCEHSLR